MLTHFEEGDFLPKNVKELYASTRDDQYLEIPSKVFYIKETFKNNFFKNLKDIFKTKS